MGWDGAPWMGQESPGDGVVLQVAGMEPWCRQDDGDTLLAGSDGAMLGAGRTVETCCRQGRSEQSCRQGVVEPRSRQRGWSDGAGRVRASCYRQDDGAMQQAGMSEG